MKFTLNKGNNMDKDTCKFSNLKKSYARKILGKRLVEIRKSIKPKLTQEKLAIHLNVARAALAQWEIGRTFPAISNLQAIADFFGVDVDYFLKDLDKNDNENSNILSILDILESVPKNGVHKYEHNKLCYQRIDYGEICFSAAKEIRSLKKQIEELKNSKENNG